MTPTRSNRGDEPPGPLLVIELGRAQTELIAIIVNLQLVRPLCDSIAELLWVVRANARQKREVAQTGVYHINFERENPCQLLRIALPEGSPLYPEISGSHYRCSVRFLAWRDVFNRPAQTQDDVPFLLTCCY